MKIICVIVILIALSKNTVQRSHENSLSYVGAVVEYSPVEEDSSDNADLNVLNADNYLKIIEKAATHDTDIIVFPESSLSIPSSFNLTIRRSQGASYIPDPIEQIAPCDDQSKSYHYSLKSISCAAKKHQMYVVINHREKVDCTPGKGCATDGFLIYNTNVAFDRNGRVIARYRKYNLFLTELDKNISESIPTTFKTDFGVTFGTFICFDLLFAMPALNLTRDLGVTDILFSTHWFSQLPYLDAVEMQAAWAYANDVNFLASGYNNPETGSGGSGIFLGKQGPVKIISEKKRSNVLLIAEIPKVIDGTRKLNVDGKRVTVYEFTKEEINTSEKNGTQKWLNMIDNTTSYTTELIELKKNSLNKTICDRGFCCDFEVQMEFDETSINNNSNYYHYRFAVFNGGGVENVLVAEIKSCGIIACINNTLESCGHIFQDDKNVIRPTTFTSLKITTLNVTNEDTFFVPVTFTQSMLPLNATDFNFDVDKSTIRHMELKNPVNNLFAFAINGRDFSTINSALTNVPSEVMESLSGILSGTEI